MMVVMMMMMMTMTMTMMMMEKRGSLYIHLLYGLGFPNLHPPFFAACPKRRLQNVVIRSIDREIEKGRESLNVKALDFHGIINLADGLHCWSSGPLRAEAYRERAKGCCLGRKPEAQNEAGRMIGYCCIYRLSVRPQYCPSVIAPNASLSRYLRDLAYIGMLPKVMPGEHQAMPSSPYASERRLLN